MRTFVFLLLSFVFVLPGRAQVITKFSLDEGASQTYLKQAESTINEVFARLAKNQPLNENDFTKEGLKSLKDLYNETHFYLSDSKLSLRVVKQINDLAEIRGIPVYSKKFKGSSSDSLTQKELVLTLTPNAKISDARFALSKHNISKVLADNDGLDDLKRRQIILQFIEMYRTAYNKKDLDFIDKTLSNSALIITGSVVKKQSDSSSYSVENSELSRDNVRYLKQSKKQYLKRLKMVFEKNDFIRVNFSDIQIVRHYKYKKVYGVKLKQRWNSSTYSDVGYLFLMIDFKNEKQPMIHVRAWQPKKFQDGSTISLYDFRILD